MSEIREEDGSIDQRPQATAEGVVTGDTEGLKPQREPQGDEQQQQPKQKEKKKKKIIKRAQALLGSSIKRIGISRKSSSRSSSPCSESPCCPSSNSYPVYFGDEPIGCCYLCFLPPPAVDSPTGPGRPSGNTSSYGFVKSLIERNDFYDPDCNVHRDV